MHVVDSHTGGMPTRVILSGGPELGQGSVAMQAQRLAQHHQEFCNSVLLEPRGQPGMVAALLVAPTDPNCATGVIYFDASAVLGMCGHGTIGLAVTLAHLGKITEGSHQIETPAGTVQAFVHDANTVSVTNVESHFLQGDVVLDVPGYGAVQGDFAYGGNWFFITDAVDQDLIPQNIASLTALSIAIRNACHAQRVEGPEGQPVDHVILSGASPNAGALRRNFVLCPDDEYDRSPCGTGSSAFTACLAAKGQLDTGQEIILESVIGSAYRLSYAPGPTGGIIPTLTGQAHIMSEGTLIFSPGDPFQKGITFAPAVVLAEL